MTTTTDAANYRIRNRNGDLLCVWRATTAEAALRDAADYFGSDGAGWSADEAATGARPFHVATYRYAYLDRSIDLCRDCAESGNEGLPALGPVEHAEHFGRCAACLPLFNEVAS